MGRFEVSYYLSLFLLPLLLLFTTHRRYLANTQPSAYVLFMWRMCEEVPIGRPLKKVLICFPEGDVGNSSLCAKSKESDYNQGLTQQA